MSKKKITFIAIFTIIILSIIFILVKNIKNHKNSNEISVKADTVSRGTIVKTISAKGEVKLLKNDVIHVDIDSDIESIPVKNNDFVKKGDLLIKFKHSNKEKLERNLKDAELELKSSEVSLEDSKIPADKVDLKDAETTLIKTKQSIEDINTKLQNDLKEIEINLEQVNSNISKQKRIVKDAQDDFNDIQVLYNSGGASQKEFDRITTNLKNSQDSLDILESQKKQIEQNKKFTLENYTSNKKQEEENLELAKTRYNDLINKLNKRETKNNIEEQEITVKRNQLKVQQLKDDLSKFKEAIYSPVDGTVVSLNVKEGELVLEGTSLMEIAKSKDYVIKLHVNERYANEIAVGQKVDIEGTSLGKAVLKGKISKIDDIATTSTSGTVVERTIDAEVTLLNEKEDINLLKPGFSIDSTITTKTKENVLIIPILSSLSEESNNKNYVYIIKSDNTLEKRYVELGDYSDMYVEVTGLNEGDKIVSEPSTDLQNGIKVNIISNENSDPANLKE